MVSDDPKDRRRWDLKYRYAMTPEDFDALVEDQGGTCAICGRPDPLASTWNIDHDNRCCPSGTKGCGTCVRGLLCRDCNLMLGYAGDDVTRLRSAINYLNYHTRLVA